MKRGAGRPWPRAAGRGRRARAGPVGERSSKLPRRQERKGPEWLWVPHSSTGECVPNAEGSASQARISTQCVALTWLQVFGDAPHRKVGSVPRPWHVGRRVTTPGSRVSASCCQERLCQEPRRHVGSRAMRKPEPRRPRQAPQPGSQPGAAMQEKRPQMTPAPARRDSCRPSPPSRDPDASNHTFKE